MRPDYFKIEIIVILFAFWLSYIVVIFVLILIFDLTLRHIQKISNFSDFLSNELMSVQFKFSVVISSMYRI
jgi:hypothetical protein